MYVDYISIHPPHAGRDLEQYGSEFELAKISIHPPHAGRDAKFGINL